ncbi:MAG TPA: molybdate ABC transporter permease subunit, partial [Pseudohongiella sp.]|nr:molybdate ABC transporter permease subunit [Pseudohongiella sp.]
MLGLSPEDWQAIELTLRLCLYTTLILLLLATPIAWWLASGRSWLRTLVQS